MGDAKFDDSVTILMVF